MQPLVCQKVGQIVACWHLCEVQQSLPVPFQLERQQPDAAVEEVWRPSDLTAAAAAEYWCYTLLHSLHNDGSATAIGACAKMAACAQARITID